MIKVIMDNPRKPPSDALIVGVVLVAGFSAFVTITCIYLCVRYLRWRKFQTSSTVECTRTCSLPIRVHGENTSTDLSNSVPHHQVNIRQSSPFSFFGRVVHHDPLEASSQDKVIRFSYKELQKATKNFTTVIGKGAFGPVYKAFLSNMSVVAVKVLSNNSNQGEKEFLNEVMILGRLHHKNLLKLVGYCADGGHRLLAYDFMSNGSLDSRLHDEKCEVLSWDQRVIIAKDIARGIEYLHEGAMPPVIHRDIKASNILLDSFMEAKVADFGLSKEADQDLPASGVKGTYGYVDPEYISTNSLSYKSDVYSFGILLFELITARSPIEGLMDYIDMILMSDAGREEWLQILDPRLKGDCNLKELGEMALIATQCIATESKDRPKMQEVVQAFARFGPRSGNGTILQFLQISSFKMKGTDRNFTKALSLQ